MSKIDSASYGFKIEPEADFQTNQHQTLSSSINRGSLSTILRVLGAVSYTHLTLPTILLV